MPEPDQIAALQARLKVQFKDQDRLARALRHRSAAVDAPHQSNERLEFLGDSIVGMIVCDYLFTRFPEASEGDLAKAKAYLASELVLAEAAVTLGLGSAVELSIAEEASGGRMRKSILSDTFEAVVAAIYLDRGVRTAKRIVRSALSDAMLRVAQDGYQRDYKSQLQEHTQAKSRRTPHYKIAEERGADHDKLFIAQALLGTTVLGEGEGRSKKEAEQAAAQAAIERIAATRT